MTSDQRCYNSGKKVHDYGDGDIVKVLDDGEKGEKCLMTLGKLESKRLVNVQKW